MTELILDSALAPEQRGFADAIKESAQSLLTIINDILDFSKMEAGRVDLELISFSPLDLLESSAQLVAATARAKQLSLYTYVDPALPRICSGQRFE